MTWLHKLDTIAENYEEEIKNLECSKSIKGIHINIRNAKKNSEAFRIMLKETKIKFDIIGWSETWLTREEAQNYGFQYEGYKWIWSESKYNKNGGVAIAINDELNYKIIEHEGQKLEADNLIVEVEDKEGKNNYKIIMIYRNPQRNIGKFIKDIKEIITGKENQKRNMIIMGDMNIDISKKNKHSEKLYDITSNEGYIQIIDNYTRISKKTESKLDLCYTNIRLKKL